MWLLFSILVFVNPSIHCHSQVDISPSGLHYIPINTHRNITCHIEGGGVSAWAIILNNRPEQRIDLLLNNVPNVTGITARRVNGGVSTLLITVNTSDTSVIGLRCEGIVGSGISTTQVSNTTNLTIYGNPDPPTELSMSTNDNLLMTLWTYRIIPTVTVMFNISLTFLSPSQLEDITVCVTDTDSYTFTLGGVRSCDPFTMCITATNTVGQSHPSCVNNSLPYIPCTKDIRYSLFREGDSYFLNLTVEVSECLQDESLFYVILLQNQNENQQLTSSAIPASPGSSTVIAGLFKKSLYTLTIISNNSLGIGFSEPQHFCTNDIQRVTICPTMMDEVFNISCDYVSGCNYSGCSYELSSANSYINGSIIGMNYTVVSINVNTLYNLTITDVNEKMFIIEQFNVSLILSCFIRTEAVTLDTTRLLKGDSNNETIAIAVTITILIVACIMALLILLLLIYLHRNGCCSNSGILPFKKANIKKGSHINVEYHGSGNPHVVCKTENKDQGDSNKINMTEEATNDVMYDSLTIIKNNKKSEKCTEENYSHINDMPIYHVLEKEQPVATPTLETTAIRPRHTEEIPFDDDAPPILTYNPERGNAPLIPQENPDHHNLPSVQTVAVPNFSPADNICAEI